MQSLPGRSTAGNSVWFARLALPHVFTSAAQEQLHDFKRGMRPGQGRCNCIPPTYQEAVALARTGRPPRSLRWARRQAALIRQYPEEYRPAQLTLLEDALIDIALAVAEETRQ